MNQRNKNARIIQEGASNRLLVARKLVEAIEEVHAEKGSTEEDPAIFLIIHQLTWILTGRDIALSLAGGERWSAATKAVAEVVVTDNKPE